MPQGRHWRGGFIRLLACTAASTSAEKVDRTDMRRQRVGGARDRVTRDSFLQRVFSSLNAHLGGGGGGQQQQKSGKVAEGNCRATIQTPQLVQQKQTPDTKPAPTPMGSLRKRLIIALMEDTEASTGQTAEEAADIRRLLRRLNAVIEDNYDDNSGVPGGCGEKEVNQIQADVQNRTQQAATMEANACGFSCGATVLARPATASATTEERSAAAVEEPAAPAANQESSGHRRCRRFRGFRPYRCSLPHSDTLVPCARNCSTASGIDCRCACDSSSSVSADWEDVAVYCVPYCRK